MLATNGTFLIENFEQNQLQILEKGAMGGSKGYFCAIYDEKEGLKINVEEIQLQQPW